MSSSNKYSSEVRGLRFACCWSTRVSTIHRGLAVDPRDRARAVCAGTRIRTGEPKATPRRRDASPSPAWRAMGAIIPRTIRTSRNRDSADRARAQHVPSRPLGSSGAPACRAVLRHGTPGAVHWYDARCQERCECPPEVLSSGNRCHRGPRPEHSTSSQEGAR